MAEELDDDTVAAVRKILSRGARRDLCPGCGRRELADDQDLCDACQAEAEKAKKRNYWREQSDHQALREKLSARAAAARWLIHRIRKRPVPSAVIKRDAANAGISARTLRRARLDLQADGRLEVRHRGDLVDGRTVHTTVWAFVSPENRERK